MHTAFKEACEIHYLQDLAMFSSKHSSTCPKTVSVSFETDYTLGNCACVGIAGSLEALGEWDPSRCVLAEVSPPGSNHWRVTVPLPQKKTFLWKWVVVSPDRGKVWRWEEREDRESFTGTLNGQFIAPWNGSAKFNPVKLGDQQSDASDYSEQDMPLHLRPTISAIERLRRAICTII